LLPLGIDLLLLIAVVTITVLGLLIEQRESAAKRFHHRFVVEQLKTRVAVISAKNHKRQSVTAK